MGRRILNKKTGSLALAVLLLVVLLIPTAAAQTETSEVEISVLLDGYHYKVTTDDTLVLRSGWLACSPGLVRAFMPAGNYRVTLVGSPAPLLTPEEVRDLIGPLPGEPTVHRHPRPMQTGDRP